jgi:LPXTG-site transpeptidase (sortase) family protein
MMDFFRVVPKKRTIKVKFKKAVIYSNPTKHRKVIFYLSNFVFIGAVAYFLYIYMPIGTAISRFYLSEIGFGNMTIEEQLKRVNINTSDYYINIPKILAASRVVPDVSPFKASEYLKVLENDVVAQSKGSSPPGSGKGNLTYIFAHSTEGGLGMVRKNAVFYLLGELKKEDPIFINYQGKIYQYKVYDRKIIGAKETQYLEYSDSNKEVLILQTCWPIGTDWNRLLIFGELVK